MLARFTPWAAWKNWRLREAAARGEKAVAIGKMLGVSAPAVRARAERMGVKLKLVAPPWPPERDAQLRELAAAGMSGGQIAQEMGLTRNQVIGRARRAGIALGQWQTDAEKVKRMRQERERSMLRARALRTGSRKLPQPKPAALPPQDAVLSPSKGAGPSFEVDRRPLREAKARPPKNLTIFELSDATCRWPVNEGGPYVFCGHAVQAERSYCPEHQWLGTSRGRH